MKNQEDQTTQIPQASAQDWLVGGGEMGELIRS